MKTPSKNIGMCIVFTLLLGVMLFSSACTPKFGCPGAISKQPIKTNTRNS
ncbi:MAG: hypothetical protein KJS45_03295 [Bacteroidetes bacterium]|nr:hypothetical protein [Bacteroidota bacterium]